MATSNVGIPGQLTWGECLIALCDEAIPVLIRELNAAWYLTFAATRGYATEAQASAFFVEFGNQFVATHPRLLRVQPFSWFRERTDEQLQMLAESLGADVASGEDVSGIIATVLASGAGDPDLRSQLRELMSKSAMMLLEENGYTCF